MVNDKNDHKYKYHLVPNSPEKDKNRLTGQSFDLAKLSPRKPKYNNCNDKRFDNIDKEPKVHTRSKHTRKVDFNHQIPHEEDLFGNRKKSTQN